MMSADARPQMRYAFSSAEKTAMSPVLNQPSSSNSFAVAWRHGRLRDYDCV
jgi:hypothetical protein